MLRSLSHSSFDMPADAILMEFQMQQYLIPQRPLAEMLDAACDEVGFCRHAARRAMRLLDLDGATKIGRLELTVLEKLSRTIRRFCRDADRVMVSASVA